MIAETETKLRDEDEAVKSVVAIRSWDVNFDRVREKATDVKVRAGPRMY